MIHWNYKKRFRQQLLQLLGLAIVVTLIIIWDNRALTGSVAISKLNVVQSFYIPVQELSGLAISPSLGSDFNVIGVGDANSVFSRFKIQGGNLHHVQMDFTKTLIEKYSICPNRPYGKCRQLNKALTSDWEAVDVDGAGNIAVLHEFSGTVVIFDTHDMSAKSRIHLDFTSLDIGRESQKSRIAENSLGEGIILLKNGHIAVAKERHPAAIIEFGPEGSKPQGLHKSSYLDHEAFKIQSERLKYKPLHIWYQDPVSKCDISDLTNSQEGTLYILSENCRRIVALNKLMPDIHKVDFKQGWKIPEQVKMPEAVAAIPDGLIFGSDTKTKDANVHIIHLPSAKNM